MKKQPYKKTVFYFDSALFAQRIKLKLEVNNLSLREAAEQIGISFPTLQRLTKRKTPELLTYVTVCFWLHLEPQLFFRIY